MSVKACNCHECTAERQHRADEEHDCTCPFAGWNPECPSHGFTKEDTNV